MYSIGCETDRNDACRWGEPLALCREASQAELAEFPLTLVSVEVGVPHILHAGTLATVDKLLFSRCPILWQLPCRVTVFLSGGHQILLSVVHSQDHPVRWSVEPSGRGLCMGTVHTAARRLLGQATRASQYIAIPWGDQPGPPCGGIPSLQARYTCQKSSGKPDTSAISAPRNRRVERQSS